MSERSATAGVAGVLSAAAALVMLLNGSAPAQSGRAAEIAAYAGADRE